MLYVVRLTCRKEMKKKISKRNQKGEKLNRNSGIKIAGRERCLYHPVEKRETKIIINKQRDSHVIEIRPIRLITGSNEQVNKPTNDSCWGLFSFPHTQQLTHTHTQNSESDTAVSLWRERNRSSYLSFFCLFSYHRQRTDNIDRFDKDTELCDKNADVLGGRNRDCRMESRLAIATPNQFDPNVP